MNDIGSFELQTHIGKITGLHNGFRRGRPTVLALHGWLDNAASFSPILSQRPEDNWLAIDLPGHGHSQHKSEHAHYHFIDWVSDLLHIVRAIQSSSQFSSYDTARFILVGHSMGGMIATVFASLYPEYVKQLVLIDAAGLITEAPDFSAAQLRASLDSRIAAVNRTRRPIATPQQAYAARKSAGQLADSSVKLLVDRNLEVSEQGIRWRTDPRLKTFSPIRMSDNIAHKIIANLTCPTSILIAEHGLAAVKLSLKKYRADYEELNVIDVTGGHHCHMDEPLLVLQTIQQNVFNYDC